MSTQSSRFRRLGAAAPRKGQDLVARAAAAAFLLVAGLALPACDSGGSDAGPVLSAGDFRTPGAEAPPAESGKGAIKPAAPKPALAGALTPTQPVLPPGEAPVTMSPETASQGVGEVAVLVGDTENKGDPNAKPTKEEFVVDTMVGQINGRPVFANQFFQETRLDGKLRAFLYDARIPNGTAWSAVAKEMIKKDLTDRMRDELFLAEARALLTPEEKRGLLNFITHLRENMASAARGSAIAAEDELKNTDNTTLDDKAKNERDILLLRILSARYIEPHINVSWRDVQKQYERDFAAYNPPATAMIRMIWVSKSKPDNIEKVRAALAEGESFATLAKGPFNEYDREKGGLLPKTIEGTYAETKLIGSSAEINTAAQKLSPGQFTGPIENKGVMVWVFLEKIDQPPKRDLEDANLQLEILTKLLTARQQIEQEKFRVRLMDRGSKAEEALMIDRLTAIAQERFLDNGQFPKTVQEERDRIKARPAARPGPAPATPPGASGPRPGATAPSTPPPGAVTPAPAPGTNPQPTIPPPSGNAPPSGTPSANPPADPNSPGKQP